MNPGTEQLTHLADVQMTMYRQPGTHFKVVHAQLPLAQLKTTFDRPTRKGYPQQPLQRKAIRSQHHIRQKVFDLFWLQNVASYNQGMPGPRQTLGTMFAVEGTDLTSQTRGPFSPSLILKRFHFCF